MYVSDTAKLGRILTMDSVTISVLDGYPHPHPLAVPCSERGTDGKWAEKP